MKRNENCFGCHELPIKVVHKGVFKIIKNCLTCNVARPFRSTHCSDCDNCTLRFDHHCPWIGGCVGKRNYIYFFFFLVLLNLKNVYLVIFSIIHIIKTYINVSEEEKNNNSWIAKNLVNLIPSLFTIIFIAATMLFTTGLIIYHIGLIIKNKTTKEEIKKLIQIKIGNPYDRGLSKNCNDFWTRHKSMQDNYTVKDLRVKVKVTKTPTYRATKPKIMPYSEKEKKLKNKAKKENNIKEVINSKSDSNTNSKNSKSDKSSHNKKNEQNDNKSNKSDLYSDGSSNKDKNNNQIMNKIKKKIEDKNKKKNESTNNKNNNTKKNNNKSNTNSINSSKKNSIKKDESNSDYNKENEVDDFSDIDISDENDDTKRKICNTSVKNRNNLNNNIINKLNEYDDFNNKYRFKTHMDEKNYNLTNDDNNLSYKIAQKRLEELSSEITIHEEINQLKSSMSIPRENSCTSSLSQS